MSKSGLDKIIKILDKVSDFDCTVTYEAWKDNIETIKEEYECSEETLLKAIRLRTSGEIVKNLAGRKPKTLKEYFAILDNIYGRKFNDHNYCTIRDLVAPDSSIKTIQEHTKAFNSKLREFKDNAIDDNMLIRLYVTPLKRGIVDKIVSEDPKDLNDAQRIAHSATIGMEDVIDPINNERSRIENNSENENRRPHFEKDDRNNRNYDNNGSHRDNRRCFKCNRTGHIARYCRRNDNHSVATGANRNRNSRFNPKAWRPRSTTLNDLSDNSKN